MSKPTNKKPVRYEQMLVSFVDIFGFKGIVSGPQRKTPAEISRMLRLFNEATAPPKFKDDIPDMPSQEHVSFSDLNMTVTPVNKRGNEGIVFNQFLRLVHAQSTLFIDEGVLLRGGISVGEATKSYRKFFGPAVIDAYELEQREPGPPRIVVGDSVIREVETNPKLWMHDRDDELKTLEGFLAREDGIAFIDYLKVALGEVEDWQWVVKEHNAAIERGLDEHKAGRVREKFEWLRSYHDRTVTALRFVDE